MSILKLKAMIVVDSPLSVDLDAKLKEVELADTKLTLYQSLINKDIPNVLLNNMLWVKLKWDNYP